MTGMFAARLAVRLEKQSYCGPGQISLNRFDMWRDAKRFFGLTRDESGISLHRTARIQKNSEVWGLVVTPRATKSPPTIRAFLEIKAEQRNERRTRLG